MEDSKTVEEPKTEEKNTVHYWNKWKKAAKKGAKDHFDDARRAYDEYEQKTSSGVDINGQNQSTERSCPLYWSSCKTLEPAFYARTPEVRAKRRNGVNNDVALLACTVIERIGAYLMDKSDFDSVMQCLVSDFIHADKATAQVSYSADLVEQDVPVTLGMDGVSFITQDGSPYNGEVFQSKMGFFGKEMVATNKQYPAIPLSYDDVLHTPEARYLSEITEVAYKFSMTREEAEKRFPKEKIAKIDWREKKGHDDKDDDKPEFENAPNQFVEGWECWCKSTKKVYWLTDQVSEDFLDIKDDPYGLVNFFPSIPFLIGSKPSKHLYPRPAYARLRNSLNQCHNLTNRVYSLVDGIRRRCLVDGANEDLIYALNSLEGGEFVAMTNLQNIIEKGTLENLVYWVPVKELVDALSESIEIKNTFKQEFFEYFGVPDIQQGSDDPLEATAKNQPMMSAHDRFKFQKKQIGKAASQLIESMIDLCLEMSTPEELATIVDVTNMSPQEQQLFPQVVELIKKDKARMIAIEIDTDSMSFVNEQLKANQMNQAMATVTNGLTQISQMSQIKPQFGAVGLQVLLHGLETLAPGKNFQESVKLASQQMLNDLMNPPDPGPPPPDYEMMKLELKQQEIAQSGQVDELKVQVKMQEQQIEGALKSRELQLQQMEIESKNFIEQQGVQQKAMRLQLDQMLESFMMQIETVKISLEAQKLQMEEFQAMKQAEESQMEEGRLARQLEFETLSTIINGQREQAKVKETPPQPININISMPKPKKKIGRISYDALGLPQLSIEESPDEVQVVTATQARPVGQGTIDISPDVIGEAMKKL
jgi:hypothetical protein